MAASGLEGAGVVGTIQQHQGEGAGVDTARSTSKKPHANGPARTLHSQHLPLSKATHGASPGAAACTAMNQIGFHRGRADGMAQAARKLGEEEKYA